MNIKIGDLFEAIGVTGNQISLLVLDIRLIDEVVLIDVERMYCIDGKTDNDALTVNLSNLKAWLGERQWTKRARE